MTPVPLMLRGGRVVTGGGVVEADLLLRDGRIAGILAPGEEAPTDAEVVDVRGKAILPGGVDAHCHFRERTEDFETGTKGAAAGGITTVVEMPQADRPVVDVETFEIKHTRAAAQAVVDFGLWGGIVSGNLGSLAELQECGVVGFKAFMPISSVLLEPSMPPLDEVELWRAMQEVASLGAVLAVHAEDQAMVTYLEHELLRQGRADPAAHMEARSPLAELLAIERAVTLAEDAGVDLHVVHVTIGRGVRCVADARARGLPMTVETCPSYLLLDERDYVAQGPYAKVLPPLRPPAEREALWDHLLAGRLDFVTSDHAPYTQAEVEAGRDDIWQAPNGVGSIELMLPLVLGEGLERGLDLETFVRVTATAPARRLGLYPRKGTIAVGSDADLAIWDLDSGWVVDQRRLQSRQKRSPYEGRSCPVRVDGTLVRGRKVLWGGEIVAEPGSGTFLRQGEPVAARA